MLSRTKRVLTGVLTHKKTVSMHKNGIDTKIALNIFICIKFKYLHLNLSSIYKTFKDTQKMRIDRKV